MGYDTLVLELTEKEIERILKKERIKKAEWDDMVIWICLKCSENDSFEG
jgi:hypothetical protein